LPSLSPPPSSNASIKEGYSTESGSVHSRQSSPEMGYPVNRDKDTKRTLTPPEYRSTLGLQNPAMSPLATPCVQTPVAAPVIGVGQFWFVGQAVAPVMAAPNQFGVVNIQPQVVYNGHFQVTPCPQPNFGAMPNGYCPQPALGGFVPNRINGGY